VIFKAFTRRRCVLRFFRPPWAAPRRHSAFGNCKSLKPRAPKPFRFCTGYYLPHL